MEYNCPSCNSLKHFDEVIKIEYTEETVTVVKCADCGTVIDAQIERPKGFVLKKKRGAGEIRFSENEKRNFASITLSMLGTQIKLLAAIASKTGVDEEEIKKITKETEIYYYEYLISADDDSVPPDIDD
jgi:Zn ribbon nucleic-acid-binding protein